jgi:hypothetical protein
MATRSPPIPTRSLHRSPAENRLPGWHRRVRGGCSRGASCSIMEAPGLCGSPPTPTRTHIMDQGRCQIHSCPHLRTWVHVSGLSSCARSNHDPARHTTAQHAKRSVHAKKRARGGVMQLELQGRDRRRDRVVPVGQLQGFPRHGHPPREPRLPPRACSPAGWLFGAPKSTFLTSNRPPEAISDRSLRALRTE